MCNEEPIRYDWVGIYPCSARVMTADRAWWQRDVCPSVTLDSCDDAEFTFGYTEDQVYVDVEATWFGYLCGDAIDGGCQTDPSWLWQDRGSLKIDPSVGGTDWAFAGGRTLAPGCYKVLMNRDLTLISPPPYPTICGTWEEATEFWVE